MTEDYLKNRQIDSIRGSAHFLNRVSRIAHENKRIVFLLLASWPTILLSSPQRMRIPLRPSLISKMSTIPSISSIHPLLNRKPNSYLLVCEKRKREDVTLDQINSIRELVMALRNKRFHLTLPDQWERVAVFSVDACPSSPPRPRGSFPTFCAGRRSPMMHRIISGTPFPSPWNTFLSSRSSLSCTGCCASFSLEGTSATVCWGWRAFSFATSDFQKET